MAVASVVVALGTLTASGHAAGGLAAPARQSSAHPLEPPPESLVEPPPATETLRLVEEASRTIDFCRALAMHDALAEPDPRDLAALSEFAVRLHSVVKLVDRKSRVTDPLASGTSRTIELPESEVSALEAQRRGIFAYTARLQWAKAGFDAGMFDRDELDRRLDYAFAKLVTSEFDAATLHLAATRPQYCGTAG